MSSFISLKIPWNCPFSSLKSNRYLNSPHFLFLEISTIMIAAKTAIVRMCPFLKESKIHVLTYLKKQRLSFKPLGRRFPSKQLTDIWEPALLGDALSTSVVSYWLPNIIPYIRQFWYKTSPLFQQSHIELAFHPSTTSTFRRTPCSFNSVFNSISGSYLA